MAFFNERLRLLRQQKGLSQQEFAKQIGTSKSSVNMYERGEREPGLETLETIADYFNVDMDYLLGKSEYPNKLAWLRDREKNASTGFSDEQKEFPTQPVTDLTAHEGSVIQAYRAQPAMQGAVDRLLGVEPASSPSLSAIPTPEEQPNHTFLVAAQGGGVEQRTTKATPEEIRKAIELDEKEYDGT